MRTVLLIALLLVLATSLTGCVFTNIKTPYDTDLDKTQIGEKKGESSYQAWLWLVAWGDAGTDAAARDGDVKVLTHMDRQIISILFGLYFKEKTIVYGD